MKKILKKVFRFAAALGLFAVPLVLAFNSVVSPYQSTVSVVQNTAPADGFSVIKFQGQIKNAFGDTIPNAKIEVQPSLKNVQVEADRYTNSNGFFSGNLISNQTGIVDVNILANGIKLFDVPQVVFALPKSEPGKPVGSSGGIASFLKAQLFDNTKDATHNTSSFDINGVKNTANVSEKLSVTVTAKDSSGQVDPTYLGTVRFSVPTDPNASLPVDYKFTKEDQGVHVFHLALSFNSPGEHELAVQDLDDVRISGSFAVKISKTDEAPAIPKNTTKEIKISVPKNGAILSSPRINILGTVSGCSVVSIKDGDKEIGTNIATSPSGEFTFQTPGLAHGEHSFTAFCTDDASIVSTPVAIQIDREGPSVMKVSASPNPVLTGKTVTVSVGSDEEISNAKFVINNEEVLLSRTDGKTFGGTFTAPEVGDYPYSASVFDTLGNEKHEANAGILKVIGEQLYLDVALDKNKVNEGVAVGITATAKVSLSKVDIEMNGLPIPMTKKTDFEFAGTVIAPKKGVYPFTSVGTSEADESSVLPRSEVSLIVVDKSFQVKDFPKSILPGQLVNFSGISKKQIETVNCLLDDSLKVSISKNNGTSVSGNFTAPSRSGKSKIACTIVFTDETTETVDYDFSVSENLQNSAPTSVQNLQAKPGNKRVTLFWTPAKDDVGIKQYKIKYNVCGKPLTKMNITPDDRTQWYVDGLVNHTKYCFTVTPIDMDGLEGVESNQAEATPAGTKNTTQKAPTSGANSSWINGLIVFVIGMAFLLIKRRRES